MSKIIYEQRGSLLSREEQAYVLSAFVHRFTGNHRPVWSHNTQPNGKPYPLQFKDDADWLANTYFRITRDLKLDRKAYTCCSFPTWPENPELKVSLFVSDTIG
jgi:hypothetical protein